MNTMLIGVVSTILGTIRKACGIEMRPGTLARATMALLLLPPGGRRSRTRSRHPPRTGRWPSRPSAARPTRR